MEKQDSVKWLCHYKLSKYHEDIEPYSGRENEFHRLFTPYQAIERKGNCLLNTGIDKIWDLVTGAVAGADHIYDNSHAQIGVGDSDSAAEAAQTDLQAETNKTYKSMEEGYPTSSSQKVTFKSSFGSSEANYTWNEWVVKQSTSGVCLNRKVDSLGAKSSGTWTLEVEITLS